MTTRLGFLVCYLMSIHDLPSDLLDVALSFFVDDYGLLCSVSRVNKGLNIAASKLLYRTVAYDPPPPYVIGVRSAQTEASVSAVTLHRDSHCSYGLLNRER